MSRTVKSAVLVRNEKIAVLKPVLRKWLEISQKYCHRYARKDCPYWYNERAAISFLAGAIWKSGALALEEFNSIKKYGRSGYSGRADLWFSFSKRRQYLIEAKYDRFSLSSNSGKLLERRISSNVKLACDDAKKSKEDGCLMMGITFLVPYISPSSQDSEKGMIADFYKLIKDMRMDLTALYVNPHEMKDEENDYSYPCVAIVGNVIS